MKINNIIVTTISIIFIFFMIVLFKYDGAKISIDYNCSDFKNKEEAMEIFKENKKDIYNLDKNKNGIPCESLK